MYKIKFKNKYISALTFMNNVLNLAYDDEITDDVLKFYSYRQAYNFIEFIVGYSRFCWLDFEIV